MASSSTWLRPSATASPMRPTPATATRTWEWWWRPPGRRGDSAALLRRRHHQVVEHGRRQPRLQQRLIDLLQADVAAEGVHLPSPRDRVRVRGRLQRAVGPAEPVGQQLLATDADVGEARGARAGAEL